MSAENDFSPSWDGLIRGTTASVFFLLGTIAVIFWFASDSLFLTTGIVVLFACVIFMPLLWALQGYAVERNLVRVRRRIGDAEITAASDPFNLCLNYAYGVIEGHVRRAVNIVGLEPSVGFLQELTGSQTKESLVYDLQEPYRWLADVSVIQALESGVLDLPDFFFTGDDYRYHIETEAKRRLMEVLREQFNRGVRWNGRVLKWDTIIEQKTMELARYAIGRSSGLSFLTPFPDLKRSDSLKLREHILHPSESGTQRLGISRSTLHYLRKKAKEDSSFRVYRRTMRKLALEVCRT